MRRLLLAALAACAPPVQASAGEPTTELPDPNYRWWCWHGHHRLLQRDEALCYTTDGSCSVARDRFAVAEVTMRGAGCAYQDHAACFTFARQDGITGTLCNASVRACILNNEMFVRTGNLTTDCEVQR